MKFSTTKKPKILELKKEVALLFKNNCHSKDYVIHPRGCYWHARYDFEDNVIYVYWQQYVAGLRKGQTNYVDIRCYKPGESGETIMKKELVRIKNILIANTSTSRQIK